MKEMRHVSFALVFAVLGAIVFRVYQDTGDFYWGLLVFALMCWPSSSGGGDNNG